MANIKGEPLYSFTINANKSMWHYGEVNNFSLEEIQKRFSEWNKTEKHLFYTIVALTIENLSCNAVLTRDLDFIIDEYRQLEEPDLHKIVFIEMETADRVKTIKLEKDMKCQILIEW